MQLKKILFFTAAALAALAGTQAKALIYRADTLIRQVGGKIQYVHFFSNVDIGGASEQVNMRQAGDIVTVKRRFNEKVKVVGASYYFPKNPSGTMQKLMKDYSNLIQAQSPGYYLSFYLSQQLTENQLEYQEIEKRHLFGALKCADASGQKGILQQIVVNDFKTMVMRPLLENAQNSPFKTFINQWIVSQREFYTRYLNRNESLGLIELPAMAISFRGAGNRDQSFLQIAETYENQRFILDLLAVVNNAQEELVVVCVEGSAINKAIEELKKIGYQPAYQAGQTLTEVFAICGRNQLNEIQQIDVCEYIARVTPQYIVQRYVPVDDLADKSQPSSGSAPNFNKKSNSMLYSAILATLGIGVLAFTYYYRDAVSSLIANIWQSIFGESKSSQPASAPVRYV